MNWNEKKYTINHMLLVGAFLIIISLILVIIWLVTSNNDERLFSHFSFASTVSSIILSIIAIFMSVIGESKTEIIRDRIEQEAKQISAVTNRFEDYMDDLLHRLGRIESKTDNLKAALKQNPKTVKITSVNNDISYIDDDNSHGE